MLWSMAQVASKIENKPGHDEQPTVPEWWLEAQRDFAWAREHASEIDAHAGQWVCIAGQRIVFAATDRDEVVRRVRAGDWRPYASAPYVFYVPRPEELDAIHPRLVVPRSDDR